MCLKQQPTTKSPVPLFWYALAQIPYCKKNLCLLINGSIFYKERERLLCSSRTLSISLADLKLLDVVGRPLPNEKGKKGRLTLQELEEEKERPKQPLKQNY